MVTIIETGIISIDCNWNQCGQPPCFEGYDDAFFEK